MRVTIDCQQRPSTDDATHKHYAEVWITNREDAARKDLDPDSPIYTTGFCISRMQASDGARVWAEGHGYTVAYVY